MRFEFMNKTLKNNAIWTTGFESKIWIFGYININKQGG